MSTDLGELVGRIIKLWFDQCMGWRALVQTDRGCIDRIITEGKYNITMTRDLYRRKDDK